MSTSFIMKKAKNKTSPQSWRSLSYKQVNLAAERNKEPILQALRKFISPYIEATGDNDCVHYCLEISSGSGQHVAYFAPHFPSVVWQPSDVDASSLRSISAYIQDAEVSNIKQPIFIDVTEECTKWGGDGIIGSLVGGYEDGYFLGCDTVWSGKNLFFHPADSSSALLQNVTKFLPNYPEGKLSVDFIININLIHVSPFICTERLFHNAGQVLKHGGMLFTYGPYAFHGKISPESNVRFNSLLQSQNPQWGLRDIDQLVTLAAASGMHLLEGVPLPANNHFLVWKKA